MANPKKLLVIGGSGVLGIFISLIEGNSVVKAFKESWKIANIDFKPNTLSQLNIQLNQNESKSKVVIDLPSIYETLGNFSTKYDSIICVAGGWIGGSIDSPSLFDEVDKMYEMNLKSALLGAHLATKFLGEKGFLVFTGAAAPFKEPTPSMLSYGLSKTGVHALSVNMAERKEIPKESTFRDVIDTPTNREAMSDADFNKWTKPESIAALLKMWADGDNRPQNGSFALLKNINGMCVPEFV